MLEDKYGGAPALINGSRTKLMTLEYAKLQVEDFKNLIIEKNYNNRNLL